MNEDRATRYHRLKRQLGVLGWVWTLLLLGGLTWTGWTVTLRDAAESTAATVATRTSVPGLPALAVVVYVVLLLLNEIACRWVVQRTCRRAPLRTVHESLLTGADEASRSVSACCSGAAARRCSIFSFGCHPIGGG
jgi:hypothetical protein